MEFCTVRTVEDAVPYAFHHPYIFNAKLRRLNASAILYLSGYIDEKDFGVKATLI